MSYDEILAERIRALIASEPGLSEKRMFGGLSFLLDGHMSVAVSEAAASCCAVSPTIRRLCWPARTRVAS